MTATDGTPNTGNPGDDNEFVVVLGSNSPVTTEHLGGKAARLGEMIEAGVPVPPAFCLTTRLFRRFLEETGLADELRAGATPARKEIVARELPEPIARLILEAYAAMGRPRVAVRSSASQEDSAAQSFAGQHDTILDVGGDEAVLTAVKECWASLWSDRATVYRDDPASVGSMAVVVQEMVHADVSGVLFTIDPMGGRPHRMVVESCWGLGEGLVSGKVTSDLFVVDDRTLEVVERRVRYKVTRCAAVEPGRIAMEKVDTALRNRATLTTGQLGELARLAVQVRDSYGTEQDIEWVLKDGRISLLQTRPITTRPQPTSRYTPYIKEVPDLVRQNTMWSRMDIGEIFVGAMTPLGLSFARYYQQNIHGDCVRSIGTRRTGDMDLHMGYLQGHVYLNVSYTSHVLTQSPPTKDASVFTERFASEEVDMPSYRSPFGQFTSGARSVVAAGHWARSFAQELARMRKRSERMAASRHREYDRARALDLTRLSRSELGSEFRRYLAYCRAMNVGYMPYYINAFAFYSAFSDLCAQWLGDKGTNLQNRIKTDMSNLRTVESARELWDLAQAARRHPEVLRTIVDSPLTAIESELRATDEGRTFWDSYVTPFMRTNGTRGRQEMELTHPRWVDDPTYVFQMVRRYAQEEQFSIDGLLRGDGGVALDAEAVLGELPLVKRVVLRRIMSLFATCSELREITRMAMVTSVWLVRTVVYEVGRRLVAEGVLHSEDDIAFLDFEDIRTYLAGNRDAADVFSQAKLTERRRMHEYHNRLPEPPLTFIGEYDVAQALRAPENSTRLEGLGSSPGRIVGRARIIEDLAWQADEFQPGEILIARFTDASWTPLFAIAGGVVTDIGSMLSHSSIVSREFGLPSVVNCKHATQQISTGDMIRVDGDAGLVEVLDPADTTPVSGAAGTEAGA
ncbi:PEP/pyruvate-binding domain-containing protein [Streptomyces cyaneofuscatus]|uniref:PEP/pyruvate-binding domain-containing protein n=1 Tax=Streptomyces cyaneofuscatus TaxID=66883 RepID=UPI00367419E0